jgi:hypothetical protein
MAEATSKSKANTTPEDDFYDEASASFPKAEHLAPSIPPKFGPGRLVAIWATKAGTGKSKTDGKAYKFVETTTLVLDDGVAGAEFTINPGYPEDTAQLVPAAPVRLDSFQHSTGGLVARLERRLTANNAAGVPLRYRPYIGRMNTQPSSNNKNVAAYSISEMTDADKALVQGKYMAMIKSINAELKAKDEASETAEAFE